MPTQRPLLVALRRWDQVLVLALVVIASDIASTWWLSHHRGAAQPAGMATQSARAPSAAILDEPMAEALEAVAQARGVDPDTLPELRHLWTLFAEQHPTAASVDVEDRAAVQAALTAFISDLAGGDRRSEPGGPPAPSDGGPPPPHPGAGEAPPGPPAMGTPREQAPRTAPRVPPSITEIDSGRAAHLMELAEQKGLDPAAVLPREELRRAAVESGDIRSAASQELLEAYRAAMTSLEGP